MKLEPWGSNIHPAFWQCIVYLIHPLTNVDVDSSTLNVVDELNVDDYRQRARGAVS